MDRDDRIEALEAECERLRGRIAQLEAALGQDGVMPIELRLTPAESMLVSLLHTRGRATRQQLHDILYGLRPDGGADPKIIDVMVCKARRKLAAFGITIVTEWGRGYVMKPEHRARITAMLAAQGTPA